MKIAHFSVKHPKLTTMVALIVAIIGSIALRRLPIDLMPDTTYPTITVSASYENASPEEIEELVTRPIEEAMSAVPGVEEITSTSSEGSSRVRVLFTWGTDLDAASNDIRDRLDRIISRLPEDIERPTLRKFDPSSMPILVIGASSNLDPIEMRRVIDEQIKYRIERVPGVASLDIRGGLEREIRVNLRTDKIRAMSIPLEQITSAIEDGNITLPAGSVERGNRDIVIRTPGEYADIEQLRNTSVGIFGGVPVKLRDIASVEDSSQKVTRIVRVNGQPGVQLAITKQSGKNTVEVARGVLKEVENINRELKQVTLTTIIDSSEFIENSISQVGSSAFFGGIFAVLVLLFFLRNICSTLIISVTIPLSIIATFVLIYFSGFTLNIMTLGGLALGVGMLVDNSIVVLDNIYRLREAGQSPEDAAVNGAHEVAAAVVASTLTTVVVFLPLIFVRGMSGVMFKQLALIISFSLLCSLVVSLTLIPMLASRYLHPVSPDYHEGERLGHRLYRISGSIFKRMEAYYQRILSTVLKRRKPVLLAVSAALIVSLGVGLMAGMELMPQSDEGEVRVNVEMEVGTRLAVLDEKFRLMEAIVMREVPERKNMVANIGGSGWMSSDSHTGQIRISLKPKSERTRSSEDVVSDLRKKLSGIPGVTVRTRAGTGMFTRMLSGTTERVSVEIRGYDLETADMLAYRVKEAVESTEGITDAQVSRESGIPEEIVVIDRVKAEDMGFTVSHVAKMLQTALGGKTSGYYRDGGNEYRIYVQLLDSDKMTLEEILNLYLANKDGEPVLLKNLVRLESRSGPVRIERKDQERIVTVTANTSDRNVGLILRDIRSKLAHIPVPSGFTINFTGEYEEQQKAFRELAGVFILALILVYMVMVSLYESLRDPFVVMFSIPPAAIGVVWLLFLTGTTFNMQSFIGCIMLGGIVVNNAIVLVDHIILLRNRDGMPLKEAIEEAGRRRLRPILMTASTTGLALLPMAMGLGEGGEFQAPLARAVTGGLLSATLITLVVVPVIYYIFEKKLEKKS